MFWLGPSARRVLGSDSKTHLKSRFCMQVILKNRRAMPEGLGVFVPMLPMLLSGGMVTKGVLAYAAYAALWWNGN